VALALALVLVLGGCAVPRDPEGTLERVQGGTLRVGVTATEPWVRLEGGRPRGVEVALVEGFARELRARVEWFEGSESELIAALGERQLDLVVGGLTADTPWSKEAALTRPYATTRVLVGFPRSVTAPPELDGVRVRVERGDEAAGLVEGEGAVPVPVRDLAGARGPAAAEEWRLEAIGLVPADFELKRSEHVMAARLGENAFLVRLERHLRASEGTVRRLLRAEGRT
jgi:polar amino acid transport system substrate-binding protein